MINLKKTRLHILRETGKPGVESQDRRVSPLSTEHSKEMLDFVPHYAEKIPDHLNFLAKGARQISRERRQEARFLDRVLVAAADRASASTTSRKQQINDAGLEAIVSLTDHDSIDAN